MVESPLHGRRCRVLASEPLAGLVGALLQFVLELFLLVVEHLGISGPAFIGLGETVAAGVPIGEADLLGVWVIPLAAELGPRRINERNYALDKSGKKCYIRGEPCR